MKSYLTGVVPEAILFDIDNTLYRHDEFVHLQVQVLKERLAVDRKQDLGVVERDVAATRKQMTATNGIRPSLGLVFKEMGIPIEVSVAWREELTHPEAYLQADPSLRTVLVQLQQEYRLGALTNNPTSVGWRTLDVLGVRDLFPFVVGLDTTFCSKPQWQPFQAALDLLKVDVTALLMVGDRYDVDIKPVVDRGGSGVLVEGESELNQLPGLLQRVVAER